MNPLPNEKPALKRLLAMVAITALLLGVPMLTGAAARDVADPATGRSIWAMARWSPYAVGIGIGILSWLVFLLSDNTLGASGAFAKSAGMIEKIARGPQAEARLYYQENPPQIDWGWMLLVGIVVGGFISAQLSGEFRLAMVPDLWRQQTGSGALLRWLMALAGGFLLGIGSRWAGGCTSGHGISGTMQLVVSSWVAVICFFIGGVLTALLIF